MVYAGLGLLVVTIATFILAIVALVKVSKLEKRFFGYVDEVQGMFGEVIDVLDDAACIDGALAKTINSIKEKDKYLTKKLEDFDYDLTTIKEDIENLDLDVDFLYDELTEFFESIPEESHVNESHLTCEKKNCKGCKKK